MFTDMNFKVNNKQKYQVVKYINFKSSLNSQSSWCLTKPLNV